MLDGKTRHVIGDGRGGRGASHAKLYYLGLVFDWMAGTLH